MKRQILLSLVVVATVVSLSSCNSGKWTTENQLVITEYLQPLQDGGFIADMTEEEYGDLEECVVTKVMAQHPNYNKFNEMPGKNDTIYNVMINCTAEFIGEDYHNLRRMFPYGELVKAGILPDGMTSAMKDKFYTCVAEKINVNFASATEFLQALAGDYAAQGVINQFFVDCATEMMPPKTPTPKKK